MPIYHRAGRVPPKRHSAFRNDAGQLYPEELIGNHGFTGPASLCYHLHPPTGVASARVARTLTWQAERDSPLAHRHFRTHHLAPGPSLTLDRVPLLFNDDVALSLAEGRAPDSFFYRNAQGDELLFIDAGTGSVESPLGTLEFGDGDYVVIPRGILHQFRFDAGPVHALVIECAGFIRTPKRYRNEFGQLLEHAPFSERDIRRPVLQEPRDERGEFRVLVKRDNRLTEHVQVWHPFDLVGWDGFYYPWAFNIRDFEPRVGRFHLPPPLHQTFEGDNFVVCSFCPRPYDFDPRAVPVPYHHSNVMSDEVLYYVSGEFMSRKGIEAGSLTLHPDGLPHGPHPGRTEASIGQPETRELAVMVDTFRPLRVATEALACEDADYSRSWLTD